MCYGDGSPWVGFSGYGGTGPPLCSDGDKSCNSKELALMFFRVCWLKSRVFTFKIKFIM